MLDWPSQPLTSSRCVLLPYLNSSQFQPPRSAQDLSCPCPCWKKSWHRMLVLVTSSTQNVSWPPIASPLLNPSATFISRRTSVHSRHMSSLLRLYRLCTTTRRWDSPHRNAVIRASSPSSSSSAPLSHIHKHGISSHTCSMSHIQTWTHSSMRP